MFDCLKINQIRDEEGELFGQSLVNLAKLARSGLSVAEGIVICPPNFKLKTVIKHYQIDNVELFEQSLALIKQDFYKIALPPELTQELKYKTVDARKLWRNLLENWLEELRSKVWRLGFQKGLTEELSVQPVFFTKTIKSSGEAYFDPSLKKVQIKVSSGHLSLDQEVLIDQLVNRANKVLLLPQVYSWIVEPTRPSLKITKVSPFTDQIEKAPHQYKSEPLNRLYLKPKDSSVYKIFVDQSNSLEVNPDADGLFIQADEISDFDKLAYQLVENGLSFRDKPLIFLLSDRKEESRGIRGSLNLLHNQPLLDRQLGAYMYARQKKDLTNLSLAIPFVRSVQEFEQVKQKLAQTNITRRGGQELWLELATPENLLNLKDYLEAGLDGLLLNLDELAGWVGGFDDNLDESHFYGRQVGGVLKLIEPALKLTHQAKVPILTRGQLGTNSDILQFMIERSATGVITDLVNSYSLPEYLHFLEGRHVHKQSVFTFD